MSSRFISPFFLLLTMVCAAQQVSPRSPEAENELKPVPVVSGYAAFVPTWDASDPTLVSIVSPVLLVPVQKNIVFESRAAFEGDFQRRGGNSGDFTGAVEKSIDYMELDFLASRYMTITLGRFLTPFNIFNERLYPNWIRNTQTDPLIFPIGTGSDDGLMLRGGVAVGDKVTLNYATYFSTLSSVNRFESERHAGMRLGVFLPRRRLEFGVSEQRQLQDMHAFRDGVYLQWQPSRVPFEFRSEGVYSRQEGSGMWAEGAFRLSNVRVAALHRLQLVARTQVFNVGKLSSFNDELPQSNTKRTEGGVNYYFSDGWKALASYGKTFSATANTNIWTVGMTYRFVFPLGRGE